MATTTTTPSTTVPAVVPTGPRHIVGLSKPVLVSTSSKRSRAKKGKATTNGESTPTTTTTEETTGTTLSSEIPVVAVEEIEEEELVLEEKKANAVEAVQKRIRAASKKVQRIVQYQEKTEKLNADQQAAIASKPTLEAVLKELNELLVIVKGEEIEDAARLVRMQSVLEKQEARKIAAAVLVAEAQAQAKLLLLLQFLHLHGIYHPSRNGGFAPPVMPSAIVANATGQETAAVGKLFDQFSNGPLLGGGGDAVETLSKIESASHEEVLPMVSYARVLELVNGLTASPSVEESTPIVTESDLPATASDSVEALVDGQSESVTVAAPSFMQASELAHELVTPIVQHVESPVVVEAAIETPSPSSWAEQVEEAHTPVVQQQPQGWGAPVAPTPPTADQNWNAPAPSQPLDWSSEDQSNELPSLEGMVPASQLLAPVVESDGFNQVRGGNNQGRRGDFNNGGRGGRGGNRGNGENRRGGPPGENRRGGGGNYRGASSGPREGGEGGNNWSRGPRENGGATRGGAFFDNRGGGEFRGKGRGRGEGRGRGGRGGEAPAPTPTEGAAPTRSW